MKNKKLFFKTHKAGFVLGAVLLAALTEGVSYAGGLSVGITVTPPVVVVAPPVVVAPTVVVPDDYVYYPNYGVYYNSHRHQYYYLRGDTWIWAPAPEGVTVGVLLASPSVRMAWHDSPANHHKEMLQKYPRNWKPADVHQDRKADRKDAAPDRDKDNRDKQ
ncbi:MAG: hypothetical protein WBN22_06855 [Verrucomicrobiia bacterium]